MYETNQLINKCYKNVRMATYSIDCLIEKIKNKNLANLLRKQNKIYLDLTVQIEEIASELNLDLKDINMFIKMMSFMSIKMKTLMNNNSSKFAEMLIQGTTMGITNAIKSKNEHKVNNEKVNNIVQTIIKNEEAFVNSLKTFL